MKWLPRFRRKSDSRFFRFFDGESTRRIDPLQALLALQSHDTFDINVHPAMLKTGDTEAIQITLDAVRQVFGVKEWRDGSGGLTQLETIELISRFASHIEDVKKKLNSPAT